MEEWVGGLWHKYITEKASNDHAAAKVLFTDIKKSVGIVYRALGGLAVKRIDAATPRDYVVRRTLLQKISGVNQQVSLAWQDQESLRLPESLAVFSTQALNRDLYLWLAILAAHHQKGFSHWALDNQALVVKILKKYPNLLPRYQRLAQAFVASRANISTMPLAEQAMENAISTAILHPGSVSTFPQVNYAPQAVYLWLYPSAQVNPQLLPQYSDQVPEDANVEQQRRNTATKSTVKRKKAERISESDERSGMMIFRLESLFSWSEFANLDRGTDDSDEDEEENQRIANDLDKITLSEQQQQKKSANIKLDLDLPSSAEDDIPLGQGITLPEWDYRKQKLVANRCLLQPMLPKNAVAKKLPNYLQKTAKSIQMQFEQLQTQHYWLKNQQQGEEIDINAWLDVHIEQRIAPSAEKGIYRSYRGKNRDLSCLLLADLSMSTDAHINNTKKVIDVVKDSMLLFGEALHGVGDSFAMYGFSSVKRSHVRMSVIKNFTEQYSDDNRGRIQALTPGFYTRMGAAIRQATKILAEQKSSQKLLLILTDGKPNDIDHYEGRFGIEDTHQAIVEAQKLGLKPFCITIDQQAEEYLPYIFGQYNFTVISNPAQLPKCLPKIYHKLTTH